MQDAVMMAGMVSRRLIECTEPTAQQERTPQPPPEKPPDVAGMLLPESDPQQNEETSFFTSRELQCGQAMSFSACCMLLRSENLSPQRVHLYS